MPFTSKKSLQSGCFGCSENFNYLGLQYHQCGKGRNEKQSCFQINNSHADNVMLVRIYSLLEEIRYDINSISNVLPIHVHNKLITFIGKDKIKLRKPARSRIETRAKQIYQIDNSSNNVISSDDQISDDTFTSDDDIDESSDDLVESSQKKRSSIWSTFINNLKARKFKTPYRKVFNKYLCSKTRQQRADTGLQYILQVCNYGDTTEFIENPEVYLSVCDMLDSIKSRLMFHTRLTDSSVNVDLAYVNEELDDSNSSICAPGNSSSTGNYYELTIIESNISCHMSKHVHNAIVKSFNKIIDDPTLRLESHYRKKQKVKPHIEEYNLSPQDFNSLPGFEDYIHAPEEDATPFGRLNSNREFRNSRETVLLGSHVSLQRCYDMFLSQIQHVLCTDPSVSVSLDDVLKGAFMIGCPDGAVHDITKKQNNGILTYSITLVSHTLIKVLGIKPSSRRWILPHAQLNCKENIATMHHVMKNRFSNWSNVTQYKDTNIAFYDLGDGKCIYNMTSHSNWNRLHYPFVSCTCKRGIGCDYVHIYTMIKN